MSSKIGKVFKPPFPRNSRIKLKEMMRNFEDERYKDIPN
jgi:hypothetical protein